MNINERVWLTSDTHFGHTKMYDFFDLRKKGFEEEIIAKWNSKIGKHDVVLHLGDLTMVGKEETIKWTSRLRGRKYMIKGNHDNRSDQWFADCGFTVIPPVFYIHNPFGVERYIFTHEPVLNLPDNWYNIHGHLHGNSHRKVETTPQHIDVGVDCNDLYPIQLADVLEIWHNLK